MEYFENKYLLKHEKLPQIFHVENHLYKFKFKQQFSPQGLENSFHGYEIHIQFLIIIEIKMNRNRHQEKEEKNNMI